MKLFDNIYNSISLLEADMALVKTKNQNNEQQLNIIIKSVSSLEKAIKEFEYRLEKGSVRINDLAENVQLFERNMKSYEQQVSSNNKTVSFLIESIQRLEANGEKRDQRMASDDTTTMTIINDIINLRQQLEDIVDHLGNLGVKIGNNKEFNMLNKITNSQAGEDAILAYIVAMIKIPFSQCTYLDLGANHAKEMSNTYFFYSHGARGVLVEANADLIPELKFYRNEDIIINKCISNHSGEIIDFYVFNIDGVSNLSKSSSLEMLKENPSLQITETRKVETITVNDILDQYFVDAPKILNIDVEGLEIAILKSIDFNKYRPLLIVTEMLPYSTKLSVGIKNSEILAFMSANNYKEFAFTGINSIFIDSLYLE